MLSKEFWPEFKKRFPLISRYIKETFPETDNDDVLAALINFGEKTDIENLCFSDSEIWYSASVWCFAEWEPMLSFICEKVGAKFLWVDADHIEPFDCLQFGDDIMKPAPEKERTFYIPCFWQMYGTMCVKATSLEEARQIAAEDMPLPEGSYINASFELDEEGIDFEGGQE